MNKSTVEKSIEQDDQVDPIAKRKSFRAGLESLINCHSRENGSDTPDFILAEYLIDCLNAFDKATHRRVKWYL